MRTVWFLLSTLTCTAVASRDLRRNRTRTLIHNGKPYNPEDYPYLVALLAYKGESRSRYRSCTGTLLSPLFVLTAAHCIDGANMSNAEISLNYMDSLGPTPRRKVVESYSHKDFNPETFLADIAMLKIDSPFESVTLFARVAGVPAEFDDEQPKTCTVVGFGEHDINHTTSEEAHITQIQVMSGPSPELCGFETEYLGWSSELL